jgi:streptogramin lyase
MTQTEKETLERVYSELYSSALQLDAALNSGGFESDWGWYNHGVDPCTGDVVPYPVPVFRICRVGGLAITPEGSVFDARLTKIKLMSMNPETVFSGRRAEVYDMENGETRVFSSGDDVKTFISKIFLIPSDDFRVCIYMPGAATFNEFRALLAEFSVREEENGEE